MRIFAQTVGFILLLCCLWSPSMAQPLQAGDTISIAVYQDPKLDRQIIISPSGSFSFPLAGHLKAAGLTPRQLERRLRSRLKSKYATALDITVTVVAVKPPDEALKPKYFVTGEVKKPGAHPFVPGTSVLQAISMSGGLGNFAAKKRVQIRRKADGVESVFVFDYAAYEAGKVDSGNIELQAGDVVIVPERGLFE